MSEDVVTIPVISDIDLVGVEHIKTLHSRGRGLWLIQRLTDRSIGFGHDLEDRWGPTHAVSELLQLAHFALLVREVAERSPRKTVIDVVTEVHHQLRSR